MSQQENSPSLSAPYRPVPAFQSLLAISAMSATLAVVAYACLLSGDSAMRVRVILQGAEVILLTWAAGFIASALHLVSVAGAAVSLKIDSLSGRASAEI